MALPIPIAMYVHNAVNHQCSVVCVGVSDRSGTEETQWRLRRLDL